MLDWNKIDNDKKFQQMVNDLFALEIGKPGYLPSSPYIGQDGSWDGRFEEPYLGIEGTSQVQSKWTKYSLNDAYAPLASELEEALTNAASKGVKNLYFATNAELRVGKDDHVGKLEAINNGRVERLFIYHRDALRPLIEKSPWIKHRYFDLPQRPMFVPFTEYFEESEPDILVEDAMIERSEQMSEVESFLTDNKKKILLINAPQGEGKSRFLFEIAKSIQDHSAPEWQAWFCKPSVRSIEDAFQDEFDTSKKYVLILDNADLYEDLTEKLLDISKNIAGSRLKIILTTRTTGKSTVDNLLVHKRIVESTELRLEKLSENTLVGLLVRAAQGKVIEHPERIVRSLGHNPFFVISYGRLMTGNEDLAMLKAKIKSSIETSASCIEDIGFTKDEAVLLLLQVALISPLKLESRAVMKELEDCLGKTQTVIAQALGKLIDAGVLRRVGTSIRYSSDINGNVFLSMALDGRDGVELATDAFKRWQPIVPNILSSNIAAAARNSDTSTCSDVSRKIVGELSRTADEMSSGDRSASLAWIKHLVFLSPEEVTNLVFSYLDSQQSPREVDRDTYGPVVQQLLSVPGFQKYGLDIVRIILSKKIPGTYNNYEAGRLVRESCSPISTGSFDVCISTIQLLGSWLDETDVSVDVADLVADGVEEALSGSHEHHDSYGNTMTFGRRSLQYSGKLEEYRNNAMEVLKKLLFSKNTKIQIRAAKLFQEIGHEASQTRGLLWDKIINERNAVLDWFDELIVNNETDFSVLAEIEDVLMLQWANEDIYPGLSKKAELLLGKIPRSLEFQAYKLMNGGDFVIADFEDIRKNAPTKDKWTWLVYNHMRRHRMTDDDASDIAKPLGEKYLSPEALLEYLIKLDKSIDNDGFSYVPLIETWGKHSPSGLVEIIKTPTLMNRVPERFKYGFMSVGAENIKNFVEDFGVTLATQSKVCALDVNRFINLAIQISVDPSTFTQQMKEIIPKLDEDGTRVVLNRLFYLFEKHLPKHKDEFFELISLATSNGLTKSHMDACDFLLHNLKRVGLVQTSDLLDLKTKVSGLLRDVDRLTYHEEDLLDGLLIDSLDDFIVFIDYRLRKNEKSVGSYIDAIPHRGLKVLSRLVQTPQDFSLLMENILQWRADGLMASFDIENLLTPVNNNEERIKAYIHEKLERNTKQDTCDAITTSYALGFGNSTLDIFLKILEKGDSYNLFKEASDTFAHAVFSGGFSSTLGEEPPALVNKKTALGDMSNRARPGKIKVLIQSFQTDVENNIKSHVADAEEIINPKE